MTDMQQILAGMNKLNERVQNAEAQLKPSDKLRRHSRNFARSQAGVKGKGKGAAVPLQQEQGIGAFASSRSTSLSRSKARATSGENGLQFFAGGVDDFLVVRWQKFTNTLRDTATIQHRGPGVDVIEV